MKIFKFLIISSLSIFALWYLSYSDGSSPSPGKFLFPKTGFWNNADAEKIPLSEEIELENLGNEITVTFDKQLIPHIQASNDHDLLFAQGYITAYHRLWQMEYAIREITGQMSAVFGEQFIDQDRFYRRKAIAYGARKTLEKLKETNPEKHQLLTDYVNGINTYIESLNYKKQPLEYKILDIDPLKWKAHYPLMLLTHHFMSNQTFHKPLQRTNLFVQGNLFSDSTLLGYQQITDSIRSALLLPTNKAKIEIFAKRDQTMKGVHFAVGESKTFNRKSILATSNYGQLSYRKLLYQIELKSPGYQLIGTSIPGVPLIINGLSHNKAFSIMPTNEEQVSWYNIDYSDAAKSEYYYDDKLLKTATTIEKIAVRNRLPFKDIITYTHFGPVIYDSSYLQSDDRLNLAAKWFGNQNNGLFSLYVDIIHADSINHSLMKENTTLPTISVVMTDTKGDVVRHTIGKTHGKDDPYHILKSGRQSSRELGFKTINDRLYNPDFQFVYYAGNKNFNTISYTSKRLNDRLNAIPTVRIEDAMNIQNDNFNYLASILLPRLLPTLEKELDAESRASKLLGLLKKWDFFNQPLMISPTMFQLWWQDLRQSYIEKLSSNKNFQVYMPDEALAPLLLDSFASNDSTIVLMLKSSFTRATNKIDELTATNKDAHKWYAFKNSNLTMTRPLAHLKHQPLEVGGCSDCINFSTESAGVLNRLVIELSGSKKSLWFNALGAQTQSSGSRYKNEFNSSWKEAKYFELKLLDDLLSSEIEKVITLKP